MNKFILKIGTVLATAGFLAGATYAYFSSAKVALTNITLTTGTPSIEISTDGITYDTAVNVNTWSESNFYPGKESTVKTFHLRNTNPSLPVNIVPTATVDSASDNRMGNNLEMQFSTDGTTWNNANYHSLIWWGTNTTTTLGSQITDNADHQYWVKFQLSSDAPADLTGKTATFTIGFEGHTP